VFPTSGRITFHTEKFEGSTCRVAGFCGGTEEKQLFPADTLRGLIDADFRFKDAQLPPDIKPRLPNLVATATLEISRQFRPLIFAVASVAASRSFARSGLSARTCSMHLRP